MIQTVIDFSPLRPVFNDLALRLFALFIILSVSLLLINIFCKVLRMPILITNSLTAIVSLGSIYFWTKYFL